VLDWEMATLGDPLMDLGGALAYWVQADDDDMMRISKRQPTDLPGMPTRAEVVDHYRARTGLPIDDRYHHGQTTNPAFKDFWFFVSYLDERCRRIAGIA
jgi:aminoglycoside phosphotransferase (APT) family kinase protein